MVLDHLFHARVLKLLLLPLHVEHLLLLSFLHLEPFCLVALFGMQHFFLNLDVVFHRYAHLLVLLHLALVVHLFLLEPLVFDALRLLVSLSNYHDVSRLLLCLLDFFLSLHNGVSCEGRSEPFFLRV